MHSFRQDGCDALALAAGLAGAQRSGACGRTGRSAGSQSYDLYVMNYAML